MNNKIKIVESPRDAMQGLTRFIPTKDKARYINALLKVGFDTIDFGSFVSPKAIPQLKDTEEVLSKLDLSSTETKLLAIIGNKRGAETALKYEQIQYLGFPFSISPTFLKRNINSTIEKSTATVAELLNICAKSNKELVVYISMAFGNPYGDQWNPDIVADWVDRLYRMGIKIMPLSDTVGISTKKNIALLFSTLVPEFPGVEFGFHLHTTIRHWYRKINAAFINGCKRFDTVINGLGGCPMAENRLVGNLRTSNLLEYFEINYVPVEINEEAFEAAFELALEIFP
jgi:hydroxymethylglutaryl-CoA lyase